MEDITYVSSRPVHKKRQRKRKREAVDDADSRSSKRVEPKQEPFSDDSSDINNENNNDDDSETIEVDAAMSAVRISTEPFTEERINNLSHYMRKVDAALLFETDPERRRNLSRQHMQAYIIQLEETVRSVTTNGSPARAVLDQALQYNTEWALQNLSPYGLWAVSRNALLKRIDEHEGRRDASVTCSTEGLEKIAQLEADLASADRSIEGVKHHYRAQIAKMNRGRGGAQGWSQDQDEEILDLRAQTDRLTEECTKQKKLAQEAKRQPSPVVDAQRRQALQSAISDRDQARVKNEKLSCQLRELRELQHRTHDTSESQASRQRVQEEQNATKAALETLKSKNKELRKARGDLKA